MAGRNMVQWDIDVSQAAKKLHKLEQDFEREGKLTVNQLGEKGKNYARTIAPYWSGATVRNIRLLRGNGEEAIIQARNPVAGDGHRRNIQNFNLVRWMHQSQRAAGHIRSGDRQFMFTTRKMLKQEAPDIARARFNKVVVKNNR